MATGPSRGKTFGGLTAKERHRQLHSLDGSVAYSGVPLHSLGGFTCLRCAERKQKIVELEKEFGVLRGVLLSEKAVLNVSDLANTNDISTSSEEQRLIQESAKLRITIDVLMRFQDNVFGCEHGEDEAWKKELQRLLPSYTVISWYEGSTDTETLKLWNHIEYAVVWDMKEDILMSIPKLRGILLLGAGADQLKNMGALGSNISIVRLADDDVARRMAAYAVTWVLHYHLSFHEYARHQDSGTWRQLPAYSPFERFTVGVLGHGRVGRAVCDTMRKIGYRVCAWNRSNSEQEGVLCFSQEQLNSFLCQANALVNVLPLTSETENFLDAEKIRLLPAGAVFINIGRGRTVVDDALIAALDCGHLKAAVLDAFREEPLPADSPFWRHEKVVITPHVSGRSYAQSAAKYIADNITRIQAGEQPFPVIDRKCGY